MLLVDLSLPIAEQKRQLRHWTDLLRSLMPDARNAGGLPGYYVLLVGAKADLVSPAVLDSTLVELRAFTAAEPALRWSDPPVLAVSSRSGDGVRALRKQVRILAKAVVEGRNCWVLRYASPGSKMRLRRCSLCFLMCRIHLELNRVIDTDVRPQATIVSQDRLYEYIRAAHVSGFRSADELTRALQKLQTLGAITYAKHSRMVCLRPQLLAMVCGSKMSESVVPAFSFQIFNI